MQWVLQSGTMPTLRRWVDAGSHARSRVDRAAAVHDARQPAGDPAGHADGVPAFRWYDRELGRVLVANRPDDAAIIEARASTGRGLLADDGVSISNLFTGDAPRAAMTMSRLEVARGSRRTRQVFARFLLRPDGLCRSLSRTVAEIVRERFQAARQRRLGSHPRVHRSWTFAGLRAFSNGLLRDLNTAVVSRGDDARRPQHLRGLRRLRRDRPPRRAPPGSSPWRRSAASTMCWPCWRRSRSAPRAATTSSLLSDHGQSQGEPFASRYGIDLSELCRSLTASETTGIEGSIEGWGRVDSVLEDLGGTRTAGVQQAASRRVDKVLKPEGSTRTEAELIVLGSGNLGLVYVPGRERLTARGDRGPVAGADPGARRRTRASAFVSALGARGPVAIGEPAAGTSRPAWSRVSTRCSRSATTRPRCCATATLMDRAPELYVNSTVDPDTLDVAAFEPLVGCHGGLGGWQDRGFVLAPPHLLRPTEPIMGGDELHRHLVGILEALGHRTELQRSTP